MESVDLFYTDFCEFFNSNFLIGTSLYKDRLPVTPCPYLGPLI